MWQLKTVFVTSTRCLLGKLKWYVGSTDHEVGPLVILHKIKGSPRKDLLLGTNRMKRSGVGLTVLAGRSHKIIACPVHATADMIFKDVFCLTVIKTPPFSLIMVPNTPQSAPQFSRPTTTGCPFLPLPRHQSSERGRELARISSDEVICTGS